MADLSLRRALDGLPGLPGATGDTGAPGADGSSTATALATTTTSVNVSNAAAPTEIGQILRIASLTPLAAVWGHSLPEGWVSVTDSEYGAVGDGVTNDDAAFLAARNTGKDVYIPTGTLTSPKHYLLTQTIYPISGQVFYCPSWSYPLASGWTYAESELPNIPTCILWANTSSYCFYQNKSMSLVDGVMVVQHFNYVPTAGGAFHHGSTTELCLIPRIRNCGSLGTYTGMHNSGQQSGSNLFNCTMGESRYADYHIDLVSPYGALTWDSIRSQSGKRGLLVDGCDTSRISGLKINNTSVAQATDESPFELSGKNSGIYQMQFDNLIIEDPSMTGDVIKIGNSAYSNPVWDNTINGLHAYAYSPSFDRNVALGSNAKRTCISDIHLRGFKYVDGGDSNTVHGGRIHTELGITGSGTAVTLNGQNAILAALRIKDYVNALKFGTAGNYALLSALNLNNNTNALDVTSDAAAKATGKGRGIMGLADWG